MTRGSQSIPCAFARGGGKSMRVSNEDGLDASVYFDDDEEPPADRSSGAPGYATGMRPGAWSDAPPVVFDVKRGGNASLILSPFSLLELNKGGRLRDDPNKLELDELAALGEEEDHVSRDSAYDGPVIDSVRVMRGASYVRDEVNVSDGASWAEAFASIEQSGPDDPHKHRFCEKVIEVGSTRYFHFLIRHVL